MKYLPILSFLVLLYSCNNLRNKNVSEDTKNSDIYIDTPFIQEYHDGYIVNKQISGANNIRAIRPDNDGNIWIATKAGVYRKDKDSRKWKLVIPGPSYDVKMDENGVIWAASWNGIYKMNSGKPEKSAGPKPPLAKIVCAEEGIYALGPHGIWLYRDNAWKKKTIPRQEVCVLPYQMVKEGFG